MNWEWMSEKSLASLGGVMVRAVLSIKANPTNNEGFFKVENVPGHKGGCKGARFEMKI